jgi:hypothetical protein
MPHDCTVVVPTAGPSGNQVYDDAIEKMDDADGAMGAPQASLEGCSSGFTFCASLQRASLRRGANVYIKTEFPYLLGSTKLCPTQPDNAIEEMDDTGGAMSAHPASPIRLRHSCVASVSKSQSSAASPRRLRGYMTRSRYYMTCLLTWLVGMLGRGSVGLCGSRN